MTGPAPLSDVLRRCHREELLPLASGLGVQAGTLGRDALARAILHALRSVGSNTVLNVLRRRGAPPPWFEVVRELAGRMGVAAAADPVLLERQVLRAWLTAGRPGPIPAVEIAAVLAVDPWGEPATALQPVGRAAESRPLGGALLALVGRMLVPIAGPAVVLALVLWLGRPRDGILLPAILELARLRIRVQHRFVVAIVGPPSVGKDAAISAIFGFETGNVSPIAGSTRDVAVYEVPGDHGLEVLNTPGVGDVRDALTAETRGVLDQADLFLFLVNAQGGVRQRERDELAHVRRRHKPVLVVLNKLDTLRPEDRGRMVADTAAKLGLPAESVVGAAFDPLPALADTPLGVGVVRAWLLDAVASAGRDPSGLRVFLEELQGGAVPASAPGAAG